MCISEKNNIWQNYIIKISVHIELFIIVCLFILNENVLEMWSQSSLFSNLVKCKEQHNIIGKRHFKNITRAFLFPVLVIGKNLEQNDCETWCLK